MKICSKCGRELSLDYFVKDKWPKRRQKILEDETLLAKAKLRCFLNDCLNHYHYKKDSHGYEILGCSYEEAWEHLKKHGKKIMVNNIMGKNFILTILFLYLSQNLKKKLKNYLE